MTTKKKQYWNLKYQIPNTIFPHVYELNIENAVWITSLSVWWPSWTLLIEQNLGHCSEEQSQPAHAVGIFPTTIQWITSTTPYLVLWTHLLGEQLEKCKIYPTTNKETPPNGHEFCMTAFNAWSKCPKVSLPINDTSSIIKTINY